MIDIRAEQPRDVPSVRAVVESAFARAAEADLVDRLRDDAVRISSLVAIEHGRVVGHAMFSRVWIDGDDATVALASLAPVAVRQDCQRRGIGAALIRRGIDACRAEQWPAIIVVGHPSYYPRFGFAADAVAHIETPYRGAHFMGLDLQAGALREIRGAVRYPSAFDQLR